MGHSQFYHVPGGWALAYPGATPGHLTHVFSKDRQVYRGGRGLVKDWLVHQGLQKLVDVFKGMFSQFYIFLHCLKAYKYKRQGELYSVYHKAITDVTLRAHDYFAFRIQN